MMVEPGLHQRHGRPAEPEHGVHVGLEHAVELLGGDGGDALLRHLVGGVVHQQVDAAELVHGALHERLAVLLVGDVAGREHRRPAGLSHQPRRLLPVLLLGLEVGQHDVGALAGEGDRDGAADAGVAARDERAPAGELAAAAVGGLAVVGLRRQVALAARVLLLLPLGLA
jgi:hypothetical protein